MPIQFKWDHIEDNNIVVAIHIFNDMENIIIIKITRYIQMECHYICLKHTLVLHGSIRKVCNSRNNYVDHICFHIKQQITKELNRGIVCIFEIIYVITMYTLQYM